MTDFASSETRGWAMTALRVVSSVAAVVLANAVLRDPYTLHLHGGEVMLPAPWWHVALAVADLALLGAFAASAWRWSRRTTLVLLLAETLATLASTLAYVRVDGMARFVYGFAQQSMLGTWLALVALRVVLSLAWAWSQPGPAPELDVGQA